MMIGFVAEPALLMVLFTASLISQTTSLALTVETLSHRELAIYPSLAFAGVAFTMVSLAENARIPVDNPATHLELTMVHEAMVLEYSGRHLALIETASYVKLLLYVSVVACAFAPWGIAVSGQGFAAYLLGLAAYAAKLAAGGFLLAVFETAIAKMRVFRVPDFLGAALMLGLLATLLLFVSRVT
jgi:formate hydrogenlyase subunit 4